ncbi:MAG: DegT/DnrJ/EryC1/StrS aminotransferase [candidate division WS6 bacterium GW2011_GWF2_39_15]|uniref:DegT/DnrJ/EryC1/StrS aminotransferase n=1 Tax=candidate division WS6 bacterium GW2011_GWF2_39_15 TaxID=1619100 RepID=A0A0G0MRG6_9BACT|nr:MAG: DegT/DnrJ/EryC1/StrS aminotransferase [candidate division WS6 bacterium GW2011_GWF2_39_15]
MEFIDLKAQQERILEKVRHNIDKVLEHGKYIMGPEVTELEEKLAKYVGVKHCISCANGTDALLMALMVKGIGPGDAIFTPPFTFIAAAEMVALLGATPVFVDIDEKTFNLDPKKLEEAVKNFSKPGLTPKGVIPVDLFGQPADYDEINRIAKENNLFVIEDAAQSFGGEYKGKKVCSLAEIATTSFFPAKPLGCYGDGGAIFTDDDDIAALLQSIRIHGKGEDKYDNVRVGINGRLDTMQAAVLLPKLEILDEEMDLRQKVTKRYGKGLADTVEVPYILDECTSAWALYTVKSGRRDEILQKLKEKDIPAGVYYPKPLHLQDAFKSLGYKRGDFPVAEKCCDTVFSLPMHPYLTEKDQDYIIEVLKSA